MSTLRALFLARPSREKFLILILLLGVAVFWGSNLVGRIGQFKAAVHETSSRLASQESWLSRKDQIEKKAESEASALDPSQTLDALRLNSTVSSIAQAAGLSGYNISPAQELAPTGNFAFHTVMFSVNRVTWDQVVAFYYELQKRAPYIGIDSFSLLADKANHGQTLNANMSISSVEILRGGAE